MPIVHLIVVIVHYVIVVIELHGEFWSLMGRAMSIYWMHILLQKKALFALFVYIFHNDRHPHFWNTINNYSNDEKDMYF